MNEFIEKLAIAPMLDWSDKHYRYFMRQITKQTTLYTEMVVADAIIHGNRDRLLAYNTNEAPTVVQLGGSDPQKLIIAAKICQDYGYQEINLNVGCPSERVQSGSFGACLMAEPELVAECLSAMQNVVDIPVTIKHRIGLNYDYSYDYLVNFVDTVHTQSSCNKFIIHARNAILKGLSPKDNRSIPPLRYDFVYDLKQQRPDLQIMINGGIKTITEIDQHLKKVDSVMIGREAYYNPYLFSDVDSKYYPDSVDALSRTRKEIALAMVPYLENLLANDLRLHYVTRHMIGLYHGCSKAKLWRHTLTSKIIHSNNINDYIELVNIMDE